jgi:hypothetical protein
MNEKQKLKEVAALLKLGIIGFEVPHLYDARGSGSEKKWL